MSDLNKKRQYIRSLILKSSFETGACHIGSALSCVDILVDLYYKILQPEDIFVFSKASGASTLYAILADKGYFPLDQLNYYLKNYPECSKEVPGVIHSVGSIAHGLPIAVGLAYSNPNKKVYVLTSDGECQEGVNFEASLFARQHKLTNLYVIIDNNKIQACDFTENVINMDTAFKFYKETLPNCEIVDTIKGKGVSFMEEKMEWHYRNISEEQLQQALDEIWI